MLSPESHASFYLCGCLIRESLNTIDSIAIVKGLTIPMPILQGSVDFQVYPDKNDKLWQTALEGRSNVMFKFAVWMPFRCIMKNRGEKHG